MELALHRAEAATDRRVAGVATALLGGSVVIAMAGAASRSLPMAAAGGVVAGLALVLLMGGRWIEPALVVALAAPLPALWSGGGMRIAGAAPVAAAAVVGWVLYRGSARGRLRLGALPLRTLGALVIVFLLAAAASSHPFAALRKLANLSLLGGLLLALTDLLSQSPALRPRLATLLAGVASACGGLAVLEMVGVLPGAFPNWGTPFNRAALGFGQPNGLGFYLAVLLPLVVWRAGVARDRWRFFWWCGLALASAGLVGTFSRGSWGAVIGGAAALAAAGAWRRSLRLLGSVLIVALALDLLSGGSVRDRIAGTVGDWVLEQRAALMITGVLMFLDHPLLGVGPGGYEAELDFYGIQVPELWDFQATPHNAYVQMAAETGVAGAILYVVLMVVMIRTAARAVRRSADERAGSLELALLWSMGSVVVSGLAIWPYALDTGQAVVLLFALVASSPALIGDHGSPAVTAPWRTVPAARQRIEASSS